jgi:hypothetical protein
MACAAAMRMDATLVLWLIAALFDNLVGMHVAELARFA